MKPSNRIEQIILEILSDEWVNWAGNKYSKETWLSQKTEPLYIFKAIIQYLDEEYEAEQDRIKHLKENIKPI